MLKERNLSPSAGQWTISSRHSKEPAPLSHAQQRMWFLHQMEGSSEVYNVPMAFHLIGNLDLGAFQRSINRVISRHEILRTSIQEINGEVYQVVSPKLDLHLRLHDLRDVPSSSRSEEANQLLVACGREWFDLSRLPLIRVDLIQLDDREWILLINIHHILIDEWSMEILFREIRAFYAEEVEGTPANLPDLPIQYADFANWQLSWLKGSVLEKQLEYWRNVMKNAPPSVNLQTDFPRPAKLSYRGASELLQIPAEVLDQLRQLSRSERTTQFTLLLAAFKVLLYRYSRQTDVLVGIPITNRRQIELENLIGFFLNTLVLRTELMGNHTFRQLLKRESGIVLDAFDNQDLPFEQLVEVLKPEHD